MLHHMTHCINRVLEKKLMRILTKEDFIFYQVMCVCVCVCVRREGDQSEGLFAFLVLFFSDAGTSLWHGMIYA